MCTGEHPAPAHMGVSTGVKGMAQHELEVQIQISAAAANIFWSRCALNHGSWEQLVRYNDRRITLQGRKKRQDLL